MASNEALNTGSRHCCPNTFKKSAYAPHYMTVVFVSTPVPGKAPIYIVLFIDDFVYFSPDSDVEHYFEEALASRVKVDFMGQVDYFLGILFDWK
jgi:hypothetical protein